MEDDRLLAVVLFLFEICSRLKDGADLEPEGELVQRLGG